MTAPIRDVPKIITRADARALGLKRFFTGKACSQGHISEGRVSGQSCIECCRAKNRLNYFRNHEANKEARRLYSERERKADPARQKRRQLNWKRKDPERAKAAQRATHHRLKNTSNYKSWRKQYQSRPEVQERARQRQRRYAEENPQKIKQQRRKYRLNGPSNPKGENSWLRKNQALLRSLRRLLSKPNLDHSHLLKEALRR